MGILQGDSPTPGPAMYWQPYQTEETAMRVRPSATGDELSVHNNNNNNNNNDTDVKMIQQHNTMLEPTFYNQRHLQHHHSQLDQSVKEEREDTLVEECRDSVNSTKETGEASKSASTPSVPAICAGCSFKIADRYYLVAVDKAWHSECLRCDECRRPLDTALSCFARQSRIYCRDDYHRLFGGRKQCAKCCETLQPDELVMRGREHLFHTRCFSCHVCQTHLIKGSTFGMVGALIFCQQHYQQGPASQQTGFNNVNHNVNNISGHSFPQPAADGHYMAIPPHHQEPFGSPHHHHHHFDHHLNQYGQAHLVQQPSSESMDQTSVKLYGSPASASPVASLKNQRIRTKRRPSTKSDMISIMNEREDDSFMSVDGVGMLDTSSSSPPSMLGSCVMMSQQQQVGQQQQQQKTKRLRTSFKHHQLRMLKSYFATNHNPDAKDLKQLSQKTTLSKRVLQVWFQNARAKWRRLVQKTEGGNGANNNNNNNNTSVSNNAPHNMSSSSSSSSNCSGSGNETGSPVPSSSASPSHARQLHGHHQPMQMMGNFIDHHHQQQQQQHHHHMMTSSLSRSRMSLYDEISLSGSSSVASVGFPSPL